MTGERRAHRPGRRDGALVPAWLTWLGAFLLLITASAGQAADVQAAQAQPAESKSQYVLGPGDLIQIHVHGEEDLSIQLRLGGDGYISYPLLGDIEAAGRTVSAVQASIRDGLSGDYLVDPDVRVYVLEYRKIYVNGEVERPGGYEYAPGLTVRKAVAQAGGFTDLASRGKIYIIPEEGGERRKVDADATVAPGDTVIVEEGFF